MATNQNAAERPKGFPKSLMAVCALLTAVGVGCWVYQLASGLQITGMSNITSWGLYITMFMFFVGLSAGGLIVASSAHVFNIEKFKKVALPAVITSTVSICLAAMFVLIDLGGIARVWRLLTGPNFASPLMWDVCVISIYLVINILDIVWITRGDERKVNILSRVALPTAIAVHSVTAWIFGLQIARTWNTAILAPIFVASACDSGLALLLLALVWLEARGIFHTGKALFGSLSGLLATFVAVDAFFIACELLTMGYPGAAEAEALAVMATGATAPFFWFEIIFGLVVPFLILVFAKNREKRGLIVVASVLVILGVLCKRIWLLFTAFVAPYAEGSAVVPQWLLEGQAFGFGQLGAFYAPTLPEIRDRGRCGVARCAGLHAAVPVANGGEGKEGRRGRPCARRPCGKGCPEGVSVSKEEMEMSEDVRIQRLAERQTMFSALAAVFLELPTEESIKAVLGADYSDAEPDTSAEEMGRFAAQVQGEDAQEVLLDVARERVLLVRGGGLSPVAAPYESLYGNLEQNTAIGSLNRFYSEAGLAKLGSVHDAADQIGVQCAFVSELLEREITQLEQGDEAAADATDALIESFMSQHLARWAGNYAQAVLDNSENHYWRAVALLIQEALA